MYSLAIHTYTYWKGGKMSLFDDSMIIHIESPKDLTKKMFLSLISEFIKVEEFKVIIQNQLHLYTLAVNNWKIK